MKKILGLSALAWLFFYCGFAHDEPSRAGATPEQEEFEPHHVAAITTTAELQAALQCKITERLDLPLSGDFTWDAPVIISGAREIRLYAASITAVRFLAEHAGPVIRIEATSGQSVQIENITLIAGEGYSPTAGVEVRAQTELRDHHLHLQGITLERAPRASFAYGFMAVSRHIRNSSNNTAELVNCIFDETSRAGLYLSTDFNWDFLAEKSSFSRSSDTGVRVVNTRSLSLTLDQCLINHNVGNGLVLTEASESCRVVLRNGSQVSYNQRDGIHLRGGAAPALLIEGTAQQPVHSVGNQSAGLHFARVTAGGRVSLGPVQHWICTDNRYAVFLDAAGETIPTAIGPFENCLFANHQREAFRWRISAISAIFRNCTFARNRVYHAYHRDGGVNIGASNQVVYENCIFSGPEVRAANYDVDNVDHIQYRNCAFDISGLSAMEWTPPFRSDAGSKITLSHCIDAPPLFVSMETDPVTPASFAIGNEFYRGKGADGTDLTGWGSFASQLQNVPGPGWVDPHFARDRGNMQEPDYRQFILDNIPAPFPFSVDPARTYGAPHAQVAELYLHIYKWTERTEFADAALQLVKALTHYWSPHNEFFTLLPYIESVDMLRTHNMLSPDLEAAVRAVVEQRFIPWQRGDWNQPAARAAAVARALDVFADLDPDGSRKEYLQACWNDWYSFGDTTENAPNYNRIFWTMMFRMAEIKGWEGQLQRPEIHAIFKRYRDMVSPGGLIPGIGDSAEFYYGSRWIALFEKAASLFDDPTLRWAALALQPLPPPEVDKLRRNQGDYAAAAELLFFCYADLWRNRELEPVRPDAQARILYRSTPEAQDVPDKIILGSDKEPGAPFVLMELFAENGYHAHPEWGAIQYFEVHNVPLLHGAGYNNRHPSQSNIVHLVPPGGEFPHPKKPFVPGEWQSSSYPLKRLWFLNAPPAPRLHRDAITAAESGTRQDKDSDELKQIERLTFRVENSGWQADANAVAPIFLWLDNIRLYGPAGEKMLEDFERDDAANDWLHGYPHFVDGQHATQGSRSLKVECRGGINFISRDFYLRWNAKDYTHLLFDWKLSDDVQGWTRPFIGRIVDRGRMLDWQIPYPQYQPELRNPIVASESRDHYAEFTFDDYLVPETRLRRQVVFTEEGMLIVRDTISASASADGWKAGPLWHLWEAPMRTQDHWFKFTTPPRYGSSSSRLYVAFNAPQAFTTGKESVSLWGGYAPCTVYAEGRLSADQPAVFVTMFAPFQFDPENGKQSPPPPEIIVSAKTVHVEFKAVSVFMDQAGQWRVTRPDPK